MGGPDATAMIPLWMLACAADPASPLPAMAETPPAVTAPPTVAKWPAPDAKLTLLPPPAQARPHRVLVDAGHGAVGNDGNTSARCEKESVFTLRTQDAIASRLAKVAGLEVGVTRSGREQPSYDERLSHAETWRADAVISLHSDARWSDVSGADPTTGCRYTEGAAGFSVLYSDEGGPALVTARRALAHAVAHRMREAGFIPYDGPDYDNLYERAPLANAAGPTGVWVDRHEPAKRIKMLRRSRVPLVIVETHEASDREEAARWDEPRTHDAFAAAIAAAIADLP